MSDLMKQPCSECGGSLRSESIEREFEREGVTVKLSGVKAWVCSKCGEVYFQPGGADKLAAAVECLFELAMVEKQHRGHVSASVS